MLCRPSSVTLLLSLLCIQVWMKTGSSVFCSSVVEMRVGYTSWWEWIIFCYILIVFLVFGLVQVRANDSDSQMSGWLCQKTRKSWKKRWFVLKEQVLYKYKASKDTRALHTIPVLGYILETFKEVSFSTLAVYFATGSLYGFVLI